MPQNYNPIEHYKDLVNRDVIKVSKMVGQALKRDDRDLERSKQEDYPYYFDLDYALDVIDFVEHLKEPKTREPIRLALFQKVSLGLLFGWREKSDPTKRRYRTAVLSYARKQGKTLIAAGILLYELLMEPGNFKQIATAANSKEQAKLLFNMVVSYCKGIKQDSRAMKNLLKIKSNEVLFKDDNKIVPFAADYGNLDGYDLLAFVVDEYGAAKDSRVYDVLATSQQVQLNPLKIIISTCTDEFNGPFYNEYKYAQKLLDPESDVENERKLVLWYQQDSKEEVEKYQVDTWIKSNPILEFEIDELDYTDQQKQMARKLKDSLVEDYKEGAARNRTYNILTKAFNIWTKNEAVSYIMPKDWEKVELSENDIEKIRGLDVYVGIDLSRLNDFTAVSFILPDYNNNEWLLYSHTFVGYETETIAEKEDIVKMPLREWEMKGYCTITKDSSGIIRQLDVLEYIKQFIDSYNLHLKYIQYDPYSFNTSYEAYKNVFGQNKLISVTQNENTLSEPIKDFQSKVLAQKIKHFRNPFLDTAVNNAVLKTNANKDTVKIDKTRNRNKIDNIISSIIAWVEPSKVDIESTVARNNDFYSSWTF